MNHRGLRGLGELPGPLVENNKGPCSSLSPLSALWFPALLNGINGTDIPRELVSCRDARMQWLVRRRSSRDRPAALREYELRERVRAALLRHGQVVQLRRDAEREPGCERQRVCGTQREKMRVLRHVALDAVQ